MFVEGRNMRDSRTHQPLTYAVRLPDEAQADTLRLLDASRAVVNAALAILWPHLDEFATHRSGLAWKQVGRYVASPSPHGDRQKKVATSEKQRDALPSDLPKPAWYNQRLALYRREIEQCWRTYERRN
jgi:hypothetical protein